MNYKLKIGLYCAAGLILLMLTYGNVKDTYAKVSEYYLLKGSLSDNDYAYRSVEQLQIELDSYNKQLGYTTNIEASNQSRLLNYISEYCKAHKAHISLLPQNHNENKNGYEVETNIVQFEGDYKEILQLIYDIEQQQKISKVVSANFEVKEDWAAKVKKLYATVYFQNIKAK